MAATNPGLFRYDGTMGVDFKTGRPVPMPTASSWAAEEADRAARQEASMAAHRRLVNVGKIASIAIPTAGYGLSVAGVGAPAATVASVPGAVAGGPLGTGTVVAPSVGAGAGTGAAHVSQIPMILGGLGKGIAALLGMRSDAKNREADERVANRKLDLDRELAMLTDRRTRDIAADDTNLEESKLDPFRALLAQISAASRFDKMMNTTPTQMDFSNSRPGHFAPVVTGGPANYQPSEVLRTALDTARQATLSGTGANGPATSTSRAQQILDLLAAAPQQGAPRQPISTTMPVDGPARRILPQTPPLIAPDASNRMPDDFRLSFDDVVGPQPTKRPARRRMPVAA